MQSELNARTQKIKELKKSYEKYTKLAEIEEDKIKPLMREIEKTLSKNKGKKILQALFLNLFAGLIIFLLGIWLGPKITAFFSDSSKVLLNRTTTIETVEDSITVLSK